jgi:hypothetical protein
VAWPGRQGKRAGRVGGQGRQGRRQAAGRQGRRGGHGQAGQALTGRGGALPAGVVACRQGTRQGGGAPQPGVQWVSSQKQPAVCGRSTNALTADNTWLSM